MPHAPSRKRKKPPKRVLALPDLEHAKGTVLASLASASGQRTYDHAIGELVAWYCSAPRLALSRTVVLRYRIHFEQRGISQRLRRQTPALGRGPTAHGGSPVWAGWLRIPPAARLRRGGPHATTRSHAPR